MKPLNENLRAVRVETEDGDLSRWSVVHGSR